MTERELFEEWFESSQINCKISDLDLTNHDNYWGNALEFAWQAWQAATQREGFKFVPVELPDDTNDNVWDELNSKSVFNDDGDGFMPHEDIDLGDIYKAMIGACDD